MAVGDTNLTNLVLSGNLTVGGAITATGDFACDDLAVGDDVAITGDLAVTGNTLMTGTLGVTGALSLTVPLTNANINGAVRRKIESVTFNGTIADDTTYRRIVIPGRAGVLTQVSISGITIPVGGTSTIKVLKNNATAMLAADFDPTTLTTVVASKPAVHGTAGNIAFTATDIIVIELAAGTQSTDGVDLAVSLEYTVTDL